jgi:hypothetical protein
LLTILPFHQIRDHSNPEIKQLSLEVLILKFMQLSAQWGQATDVLTSCLDPPDQKNIGLFSSHFFHFFLSLLLNPHYILVPDSAYRTLAEYGLIDEIYPVHLGGVPNQTNSSLTIRGFVAANLPCSFENRLVEKKNRDMSISFFHLLFLPSHLLLIPYLFSNTACSF